MATAGMAAAVRPKCFSASTYANVGDLLSVSITSIRRHFSDILGVTIFEKIHAIPPPKHARRQDAVIAVQSIVLPIVVIATAFVVVIPAIAMVPKIPDDAAFAAPPVTSMRVANKPREGNIPRNF
eukprot:CAMPEP_0204636140 /NCGR_PEP_ID=MMETSP0717-20131115/33337_1 /ASSEMBLY_ACC=CAM_ASM_000666 /TAXON_ID=230516 /ORGANISM="Chaetoceros curvisetus" /LENGTH=124 /DNA_ID=CAMNT_0051655125 /DNA_START=227 /DNA_END=601 /DNA_ORIENTATION=-